MFDPINTGIELLSFKEPVLTFHGEARWNNKYKRYYPSNIDNYLSDAEVHEEWKAAKILHDETIKSTRKHKRWRLI